MNPFLGQSNVRTILPVTFGKDVGGAATARAVPLGAPSASTRATWLTAGMPRVEIVKAWRTGLALPNRDLEPTGRSFIGIPLKTDTDEYLIPLSIEEAHTLAGESDALCREAEAQSN